MPETKYDLRVVGMGAGVQSTGMKAMADAGEFGDAPDVAIFSDTQCEPPWVYIHLIPRFVGDHPKPRGGVRAVIPGKADY